MKKYIYALPLPLLLLSSLVSAAYQDHFPAYFEYCTGSRWMLQSGEKGGSPGHGFTYIHGLCKDYRSDYPRVIPCAEVSKEFHLMYPHSGVGISLDKNFTNVMWVAVPGRDFMINGNRSPEPISRSRINEHISEVTRLKIFDGVRSKSDALKTMTLGTPEYFAGIALDTLGTDHAVNWARELHCATIPVPVASLGKVADFLNKSNEQFRGEREYEWSKLSNNCVHISINQSAALGINKPIALDQKFLRKLTNMALPANGFLMYADRAVLARSPSLRKLQKSVSEKGFHHAQVGAMLRSYDAFPSGEYFKTDELSVLTAPRISKPLSLLATPRSYARRYMTPANSELKANAEMWVARYQRLLNRVKSSDKGSALESYLLQQLEISKKIVAEE